MKVKNDIIIALILFQMDAVRKLLEEISGQITLCK